MSAWWRCALCGVFMPKPKPGDKMVRCPRCHSDWIVE